MACKTLFQFKYNLDFFKDVVIIFQVLVTVFTSFITYTYIIYINFVCHVLMSKYIYKKRRHLFTNKLYFGLYIYIFIFIYLYCYKFKFKATNVRNVYIC